MGFHLCRCLGGPRKVKVRILAHWAVALVAVAALAQGCALFGGSDDETMNGGAGAGFDSGDGYGNGDGMRGGEMAGEATTELETIYFDFDRAVVREDQKPALRQNASVVQGHGDWRQVVIEGHCDERGSEEYNLALGERRANAVKRYLVDSGVRDSRLDTVSFGESRPAVQGHDESAWKWNRRAEFRVVR